MKINTTKTILLLGVAMALGACAPDFNPPADYQGGFLVNTDHSRTISVASGDTLYVISRRYDVPTRVIAERNGLKQPYTLAVGQSLILDPTRIHTIAEGDTLQSVARRYDVDESVLAASNELMPPYKLRAGQELWIPDPITNAASPARVVAMADLPPPGAAATIRNAPIVSETLPVLPGTTVLSNAPPADAALSAPVKSPAPVAEAPPVPVPAPPKPITPPPEQQEAAVVVPRTAIPEPAARASARFSWPVKGKVIAKFGPAGQGLNNDGINIAAPAGTQVRAADNGVVAYAGSELKGFGNLLLIKHADGWTTAYAHNANLLVKRGDKVVQGQVIATVGKTGNVDAPQLHFEVRKGTQAMDPMEYLAQVGG